MAHLTVSLHGSLIASFGQNDKILRTYRSLVVGGRGEVIASGAESRRGLAAAPHEHGVPARVLALGRLDPVPVEGHDSELARVAIEPPAIPIAKPNNEIKLSNGEG